MEKKVHFKLHKVKKHWVTIAVTGLALGLSFAGLSYASAEEQPTPVNEATVEAIIKEGAVDVEAPATSEATTKTTENTTTTASSEAATVSETPVASSEVASTETASEKPSSEVSSTTSSEGASSEIIHSEVSATNTSTNNENLIISTSPDKTTLDTSQKDSDFTITVEAEGITKKTDKRESFVSDANGVTYYVDAKGQLVTGPREINGSQYYFNDDGTMVKGQLRKVDDKLHFYDENDGKLVTERFITFKDNHYIPEENYSKVVYFNEPAYIEPNYYVMPGLERYYFDKNGNTLKKGRQTILGDDYYIYDNGQVAVHRLMELDHKRYYFDDKGALAKNKQFPIIEKGLWKSMPYVFYSDHDGVAHYLNKQLNIVTYPFPTYYTLPSENNREYPKNQFMMDYEGRWYYFNKDGFPVTGPKTIDGFELYFHESSRPEGHQAKGEFINIDNKIYYFDKDNGRKVKDTSFELNGIHYIADKEGNITIQGDSRFHNQYVSDDKGNWYYYNADGNKLIGEQTIDNVKVYFKDSGVQVKGHFAPNGHFYDKDSGELVTNAYVEDNGNWYYVDENGQKLIGNQIVDSYHVCFDGNGRQLKGEASYSNSGLPKHYYDLHNGQMVIKSLIQIDGKTYKADNEGKLSEVPYALNYRNQIVTDDFENSYYYDYQGMMVKNQYVTIYHLENDYLNPKIKKVTYYAGYDGKFLHGPQTINGVAVYFNAYGEQIKDQFADDGYYYDKDTGALVTNRYVEKDGKWYYVNDKGDKLIGAQTIDGVEVYFDKDGVQAKGVFANADHFYDKDTGAAVRDQIVEVDGKRYYVGQDGRKVYSGTHIVHGEEVNLIVGDGHQAFGEFTGNGDSGDYIGFDGKKVTKASFVKTKDNHWYYLDGKGNKLVSVQVIDGELYYFGLPTRKYYYGMQSRGELIYAYYSDTIPNSSHIYYLDEATGAALKNQYHEWEGSWYYFGPNWYALTGEQTIDNVPVYFHSNGKQAKGELVTVDGKIHYYDANSGARLSNIDITIKGQTYHFDADGNGTPIS
ncbi:KxYKxGKxW signal peptide domain-containing protein [Streptococcus salivarius]